MNSTIQTAIIGASGYTGLELIKMVHAHRYFNIHTLATTQGDTTIDVLHPSLQNVLYTNVEAIDIEAIGNTCDLIFLAVPHQTAMPLVAKLLPMGVKIVDLSADYRLSLEHYEAHYCTHTDAKHLKVAAYGLPELYSARIKDAQLVANPGCYPTAALLGVMPFMDYIKKNSRIIIDAKSGVSGAGKKLSDTTHFVNINENMHAYAPLTHRHSVEIKEKLQLHGVDARISFVPHLVGVTRGMLASIYLEVDESLDAIKVLENFYKQKPFVRIVNTPPSMKQVNGTNFCDVYVKQEGDTLFVATAIDNLMRGASSQAVVNANIMYGLALDEGIPLFAQVP